MTEDQSRLLNPKFTEGVVTYSVWLDLIRGVAALVVFIGHARVLLIGSLLGEFSLGAITAPNTVTIATADARTSPGHIAVIVFFVLSGYLVGGEVIKKFRNRQWSTVEYAIKRLSRLWTVLIPVLILGYVIDHFGLAIFGPDTIYGAPAAQRMVFPGLTENSTIAVLMGNILFLQGIVVPTFGTNGPLWSLAYEFWFYTAFPLLVYAICPRGRLLLRLAAIVVLMSIGFFVGSKICLYFVIWLMGASLVLFRMCLPKRTAQLFSALFGVFFILMCFALLRLKLPIVLSDFVEAFGFAVTCYAILNLRYTRKMDWIWRVSSGISSMSYTLYLVHAPVLVFICAFIMPVWSPWPVSGSSLFMFGLVCMAVFVASLAVWWLFERNTSVVRQFLTRLFIGELKSRSV